MSPEPLTLDSTPADCAAALFDSAMLGGPDELDDDPILKALYWHCRQYMHGVCTLLAIHLNETRGLPVILLEGRPVGDERWQMRHAVVAASAERMNLADFDSGYAFPIIDAAGAGTFGDRAGLYDINGWEFQIIYAAHSDNQFSRLMGERRGEPVAIEDHVLALPGLCCQLELEFDLRRALAWILENAGADTLDNEVREAVEQMLQEASLSPAA